MRECCLLLQTVSGYLFWRWVIRRDEEDGECCLRGLGIGDV